MAKQQNSKPATGIKPAASGSGGPSAKKSETKKISGGSCEGTHVGPKNAPYYEKS